jgi:hypothetical protein
MRVANYSRRHLLCVAAVFFFQIGCAPATAPMSDAKKAKELLQSMLDEWKAGTSMDGMKHRDPPIYVIEDLWRSGNKLDNYTLVGESETLGSNIRFEVELKCNNESGKVIEKSVRYIVTTQPALTMVREEG